MKERIRGIGINNSMETGIRIALSFSARLIIGVYAGFPPIALGVSSVVAFVLTSALEIPAGVFADRIGTTTSVILGYRLQICCAVLTIFAVLGWQYSAFLMWFFLVAEAVIDSLGNSLISGAKEASHQAIMDKVQAASEEEAILNKRYLELGENYGRIFLVIFPILAIGSIWILGRGVLALISPFVFIGIGWFLIEKQFRNLSGFHGKIIINMTNFSARQLRDSIDHAKHSFDSMLESTIPVISWIFCRFVSLSINCYLMISILRLRVYEDKGEIVIVLGFVIGLIISRILRGLLFKKLIGILSPLQTILVGSIVTLICSWVVFSLDRKLQLGLIPNPIFFLIVVTLADLAIGLIDRPSLGEALRSFKGEYRATASSLMSGIALILQAIYAVFLVQFGLGVPKVIDYGWQLLFLAIAIPIIQLVPKGRSLKKNG